MAGFAPGARARARARLTIDVALDREQLVDAPDHLDGDRRLLMRASSKSLRRARQHHRLGYRLGLRVAS